MCSIIKDVKRHPLLLCTKDTVYIKEIPEENMTRKLLREHTFKVLFSNTFELEEDRKEQILKYFELEEGISEVDRDYIVDRCLGIEQHLVEIDKAIGEHTTKWKTSRMNKVDLTIIRLAYYEINFDEEIPVGVAINEAVELAKKFSGDEGPSFVNGVLAKLLKPEN